MKTIKLLVEVKVPDNYQIDEPIYIIEDAMNSYTDVKITNATIIK